VKREDFRFTHRAWAETALQGVVFNANYYRYFDVAITEYWRAIGFNYPAGLVLTYGTSPYATAYSLPA